LSADGYGLRSSNNLFILSPMKTLFRLLAPILTSLLIRKLLRRARK
jgi:hypothetical protein